MWEGWSDAPRQKGTIPIGGASKISQIEDGLAALGWTPTEKEMQLLNEVSITELGFPHDFLESKESILGNTLGQVIGFGRLLVWSR
jgi:hypothetical protein